MRTTFGASTAFRATGKLVFGDGGGGGGDGTSLPGAQKISWQKSESRRNRSGGAMISATASVTGRRPKLVADIN